MMGSVESVVDSATSLYLVTTHYTFGGTNTSQSKVSNSLFKKSSI